MIYVGIMIVIFGVAVFAANSRQQEIYGERVFADAKNVLFTAVVEIDTAVSVGDGFSHSFFLTEALSGGTNYSIGLNSQYQIAYIEWMEKNYTLPLTTSRLNGSFVKGMNRISNHGGMITIERPAAV